jgi:hypothetical protein
VWLSFAGGISLAYVFVYVLPKLAAQHQVLLSMRDTGVLGYGMRQENPAIYDDLVRWLLAGSTILGWTLGHFIEVGKPVLALWFAFLAGSIIVIVIIEEAPLKKAKPFWPLLFGATIYSALILGTEAVQKAGY